ncbi:MAG: hypothetical protein DMF02_09500 [Verrucomicrobia bacterium]|nr:MAG: hypothetical protein DMF02_09500 [Verrucomicrobiota bacterium]
MRTPWLSRGQRALLNCAPINQGKVTDRCMRSAVSRAADSPAFANQQNFDRFRQRRRNGLPKKIWLLGRSGRGKK